MNEPGESGLAPERSRVPGRRVNTAGTLPVIRF